MHIYVNVARTVVVVQRAATTKVGEDKIAADLIKLLDSGGLRVWLAYVAPVTKAVVHLLQVVAVTFGVQLTHKHPRATPAETFNSGPEIIRNEMHQKRAPA